jgi:hypothetical protein
MKSPFKYGKVVTGKQFINRKEDIKRTQNNISASINTILISPRRWGNSSLMKHVEFLNNNRKIKFAFIDFFNIRTEEDFLEKYSREIIRCSISKKEELLKSGTEFFQKIIPSFTFGADPINDFSVSFNWNEAIKTRDEIINLPETIARKKGIKIVVCIDEFQNIARLQNNFSFEQELRSYWQYHENTSYCLYGSRKHMMLELFKHESRAFYRFGDLFMMEKIPEKHWIGFIMDSFEYSGKSISKDLVKRMIAMTNMLYAILAGETKLTAAKTMQQFKLGTSRNVSKNKQILIQKDIVEIHGQSILFNDPIFEYWLRQF